MAFDKTQAPAPGSIIDVEITDIGFGGDGVGRLDGMAVFVPYTLPGETVRARVFERKRRFLKAWPKEILTPSPDRIQARCGHYQLCAGCAYQHIPYVREREIKADQVRQLLQRIGHLEGIPITCAPLPDALGLEDGYHYRNRVTVHRLRRQCGFFKHDNHQVLTIEECPISAPGLQELILDEARHPEGLPRVDLRIDSAGQPVSQAQAWFQVDCHGHTYRVPLESFFQTHFAAAAQMIDVLEGWMSDLSKRNLLIDGYGGVGLFSVALGQLFSKTILVELDRNAVEAAQLNMRTNRQESAFSTHAAPLETTLSSLLRSHDTNATSVILDPPRVGLQPQVIDILLARTPQNVFYISCDPSKLARDLARLNTRYLVKSVQLVDMFPRTAHIESIAFLELKA